MFYFQMLLTKALAGIDATSIVPTVIGVAYVILAIGLLIGLYRAAMRGGDVQSALSSALIYIIVAVIIANWGSAFRGVNDAFNQIAQAVGNASGVGDMFRAWLNQLQQQAQTNPGMTFFDAITGDISGGITVLLLLVGYILFAVAMIVFCFFYTLYGTILYVVGPLVLAFLPITGANQIAKSYSVNLMIWNFWGILYAILGALMTAIHVNRVEDVLSNGFAGFLLGVPDAILLGLVSIFYALAIAMIPVIASKILSGDVGATAFSLVRAASTALSTAITAGTALAGAGAAAGGGAGGGASGGGGGAGAAGGGAGAGSGASAASGSNGGSGAGSGTTSSSPPPTPPAIPTVAQMLQTGIANAVNGTSGSSGSESSSPASSAPPAANSQESSSGSARQNATASS